MTTQNPHGSSDNETADLVRSVAISSARLWEEVLERLVRVERSQAELTQTLARLQSALPTGSVTPELSSASNAALPAAALPPPPSRVTDPIEVNGLEINGRQPSLGSAPDHHVDAQPSWATSPETVAAPSSPAPPVLSGSTPVLDLAGSTGPDIDASPHAADAAAAPVAWDATPAAPPLHDFAEPHLAAAPPPPPPGFSGPDGALPPPPPHDLQTAPAEGPGDFLAEGPGEPVEAPRSRKFSLRRKSSKKAAATDPIAESMADSILAAAEGGVHPGFEAPQPALAEAGNPALADLPPPPAAFAPPFSTDSTPPPVWNGVTEASATTPDTGAFAGLHAVQPAADPSPEHPAFSGAEPATAPVQAEEPHWTAPAPPDPAWSVTPPPPAVPTEQTWTPAASVAPPPPPMAPVPPTVMGAVPEPPFVGQPQAAPPVTQPPVAPSPFVEPQVAQAPAAAVAPPPAAASPFVEPPAAPSPFVEPPAAAPPAAASPFVEPQVVPSPFVKPQVTSVPVAQAPAPPSPFVQPPAAPAGFSLEDLQGAGAIGAPLPPVAAPVVPDAPAPAAPAGFSLEDLQGAGAIGAPVLPVAAPTPAPPPPPPGFANQPASIESLGLDPDPGPNWENAAPVGFAAPVDPFAPQGAPEPPAPPVGFDRPQDTPPSAPPPPAGFSTADFSGTGAIGGSIAEAPPAPSAAPLMGGEVPEPPITPDFFARAGRKRR